MPYKKIQQGTGFRMSDIAGVLVTHEHRDHCIGINDVLKHNHKVYMTQGTTDALINDKFLVEIGRHNINIIKAKQSFRVGSWTVLPFDISHDVKEPVGFLLQSDNGYKVLFATDTYYIRYKFQGVTHMMVEVNYSERIIEQRLAEGYLHPALYDRILKSHFSLENYLDFLKANDLSKLEEIHLIHLSGDNADREYFKTTVQKATGQPVYIH